jgi:hypothetical protein
LTSWIQSGPLGTALPDVGRQNSILGIAGIYAQACRNASAAAGGGGRGV